MSYGLAEVDATIREPTDRRLRPEREALLGAGHTLLRTSLGPLDCLGQVEGGLGYDDLLDDATEVPLRDKQIRVLHLSKLLELKRQWSDEESQLRAAILEHTLRKAEEGGEGSV